MKRLKKALKAIGRGVATLAVASIPALLMAASAPGDSTVTAVAVGTAIAGVLTPFVSALVNSPRWSSKGRAMVAAGVGIGLGVLATAITGGFVELPWTQWGAQVLAVVGVSQTLYSFILKTPVESLNEAVRGE